MEHGIDDSTSVQLLRDRLSDATADLQQFAYATSHDLRSPLSAVNYACAIARRHLENGDIEQAVQFIRRAEDSVKRTGDMLDGMAAVSRVNRNSERFVEVDLNDAVREAVDNLQSAGRWRDDFACRIGDLPNVAADRTQIVDLFERLLENATKFRGSETPRIDVRSEPSARGVCIAVADNGIGFDQCDAAKIFGVFERLHGDSEYTGLGVGLAVCKRIAVSHGGSIRAESTVGSGSTFYVTLDHN